MINKIYKDFRLKVLSYFNINQLLPSHMKTYLVASVLIGFLIPIADYIFATLLQHSLYFLKVTGVPNTFLFNVIGNNLNLCLVGLLLIGFGRAFLAGARQMISSLLLSKFVVFYRKKILERFIKSTEYNSSETVSIFTEVIPSAGNSVFHFSLMISSLVTLVILIFFSLTISYAATLLVALLVVLFWVVMNYVSLAIQQIGKGIAKESDGISRKFVEGIKNHFIIRVYDKALQFTAECDAYLDNYGKGYFKYSLLSMSGTALPLISTSVIITTMIYLLSMSYLQLPPAKFLLLIFVLVRTSQSLGEFSNSLTVTSLSKLFVMRLLEIVRESAGEEKQSIKPSMSPLLEKVDSIQIKNLNYYLARSNKKIISNLSITLNKGDVFLIKGVSGAGKSTLISLIIGLLQPESGRVFINGSGLNEESGRALRNLIGYVGSEPYFVNGTIEENLLYLTSQEVKNKIIKEDLWEVLRICKMDNFIKTLPGGLLYVIDDSVRFSAGQKQRLALAGALIRKPEVLILDEATSNLDIANEAEIFDNLKEYLLDHITIVVTHRNSLDHVANKVTTIG